MAEMDTSGGGGHKKGGPGVKKGKKLSTRVDLTPMVDLGFLLITFFIFTTTMSQPTAMKLYLPKDVKSDEQNKVKNSAVITLMLGKNDVIYYYEGDSAAALKPTDFKKVRDIVIDKKRRTDPKDFVVVIKPTVDASYKNTINILDEMTIDGIKRYAMVDISPDEYKLIKATEVANGIK